MRTQRKSHSKRDLAWFVLLVLVVAWTPMIISNPLPKNAVSAKVLENPSALFPDIPGYSKSKMITEQPNIPTNGAEYGVEYRSNEDNMPVRVFIQRTKPTKTIEPAENLHLEKDDMVKDATLIYFNVIKESPRFFIFQSADEGGEVLRIAIETPSDEKAGKRIEEVASALTHHIS
jgi:hypothetical protein